MSRRTMLSTVALAAALVLSVPGLAAADIPVGHSGSYGMHSLTDTREYSGARCLYNDDMNVGADPGHPADGVRTQPDLGS